VPRVAGAKPNAKWITGVKRWRAEAN